MSKEKNVASREEQINEAKIQMKTEAMVKSVTMLTELPENFLACGTLPDSDEIFVARVTVDDTTDVKKQIEITDYDYIIEGTTNKDLMEGLDEAYGCPILFDDYTANKILGDERTPTQVSAKYKLGGGKQIDIFMPKMEVKIH